MTTSNGACLRESGGKGSLLAVMTLQCFARGQALLGLGLLVVFPFALWAATEETRVEQEEERMERVREVAGRVSYVGNRAFKEPGDGEERSRLEAGSTVYVDDVVVADGGPIEIQLRDGSALRVASGSSLHIEQAAFSSGSDQARSVSVRLLVGRAWATVASAFLGEDRFEVRTQTAAAGVRGTSFRVDARQDSSTLVRVYQGAVAVRGLEQVRVDDSVPPTRRQVEGPAEVTRQEWERRVEAMMGVEVSAAGRVGEPAPFDSARDSDDPWVRWNLDRDAAR